MGLGKENSCHFCLQKTGHQCNRDQRLARWWKIKQASRDPREWTPARSEKRTLAFSPLWKEPGRGLLDMEISQEDLGEKTHLPEWLLAPNTCGGPGCLDSWLGGFLMLMEKPTHLVLCVRFALLLTVLLLDTLLPSEFLFIVNLPWPLLLIVRLRVLSPQLVPLLSSSVNKKLDYCEEAISVYHCCGLFTKKLHLVNGMLNTEGILFLRWGSLSPWNKGSQGSDSERNEITRLRKTQKISDVVCEVVRRITKILLDEKTGISPPKPLTRTGTNIRDEGAHPDEHACRSPKNRSWKQQISWNPRGSGHPLLNSLYASSWIWQLTFCLSKQLMRKV